MKNGYAAICVSIGAFLALLAAAVGQDAPFRANMWIAFATLAIGAILLIRRIEFATPGHPIIAEDTSGYFDSVVRYGVIAAMFWGIAGFLVGIAIASELSWPLLNVEPWFNFGRLRPLHTSAVIFAFGGNALIANPFMLCSARPEQDFGAAISRGLCSGATTFSS